MSRPVHGCVRLDRRTKTLVKRLRKGEIALINHKDLDWVAASSLRDAGVSAVLNASASISGRYPNTGPRVLIDAGIPVIDQVPETAFDTVNEGETLSVDRDTGEVTRGGQTLFTGEPLTAEKLETRLQEARANLQHELRRFVENTLTYVSREEHVLIDSTDCPRVRAKFAGRHVLVVVRGHNYREDLHTIAAYIRDVRPTVIAVDGGADAVLEMGLKPDIILGDMDSVSDSSLRCGAELVVHGYPGRDAPGMKRLEELGLPGVIFAATGTSEDLALLLAYEQGAELIVAVGTHFNMVDFLDKGRDGMASTFLTRLKVGAILVDAKGVSKLYGKGIRIRHIALLLGIGLLAVSTIIVTSPAAQQFLEILRLRLVSFWWYIWATLF